ncbi:PREDICTED: caspase-3-like [Nanorana parkeri]|uniref:caspase-3-like n=1 Tax=Nanorana parkeri TaxID=125878 RepID=UPI00085458D7|nr:PREDICTED: caspase-3-like [Nanorana parkeri]
MSIVWDFGGIVQQTPGSLKQTQRSGTQKDADSLKKVFESIGFQVQIEKDAPSDKISKVLKRVAKDDHSESGCFVCVVLSHGKEGGFYTYDDFMEEEYLFNMFKGENPDKGLVGKPKLFFFQVCRGTQYDTGVTLYSSSGVTSSCKIPKEADFLCHYSTPAGYFAFRNRNNGSWFIQSLCEMLEKYWKEYELLNILTRVNQKVALEFESNGKKEMPCIVSKLTKDLYL